MIRAMRWFGVGALALCATACCGASAANRPTNTAASASKAPEGTCLKEKGCPKQEALPVCGADLQGKPIKEVLAGAAELVGKEAAVTGPLRRAGTVCTLALCAEGQCCNSCGASLVLSDDDKIQHMDPSGLFLYYDKSAPGGKQYSCGGDDSLVCCSVRADGQAVIAVGQIKVLGEGAQGKTHGLVNARLCVPPLAVETKKQL